MRKETHDDKNERIMKTETLGGDARIMKLNEVILRQITQKKIYNNTPPRERRGFKKHQEDCGTSRI